MKAKLTCHQAFHQNEPVMAICSEPYCNQNRFNCSNCILSQHKHHIDSMIKIQDIYKGFTPEINWPRDSLLKSLGNYIFQDSKTKFINADFINDELLHNPNKFLNKLFDDLIENLNKKINELRNQILSDVGTFTNPRKYDVDELRKIYNENFNLNPVKHSIESFLANYSSLYYLTIYL